MLTVERARELFIYDPHTGGFTRRSKNRTKGVVGESVGFFTSYGYIRFSADNKQYLAHRVAWLIMTGSFPSDQIDHINGDRADNRWANLRQADNKENSRNQSVRSTNKSGVLGVNWITSLGKWRAQITVDGKSKHLGVFTEISDAEKARKDAENNFGFHGNHGRSN